MIQALRSDRFPVILAAVVHFFLWLAFPVVPLNDSVGYIYLTHRAGHTSPVDMFSPGGMPALQWDRLYPQGYAWFLDLVSMIAPQDSWLGFVIFLQHLMVVLCVWLVIQIGTLSHRRTTGWLAGVFLAISSAPLLYAQSVMSETLFYTLCMVGLWRFTHLIYGQKTKFDPVLIGLAFGASAIIRPIGLVMLIAMGLTFLALNKPDLKTRLKWIGMAAAAFISWQVVHTIYISNRYGQTTMTTNVGRHIANRVITQSKKLSPQIPEIAALMARAQKSGVPFQLPGPWWTYWRAFRDAEPQQGVADADAELGRLSRGALWHVLDDYVLSIPTLMITNVIAEDKWITYPESIMTYDHLLFEQEFARYISIWSIEPEKPGIIPPREFELRRDALKHMNFRPPVFSPDISRISYMIFLGSPDWRSWVALFFLITGIALGLRTREPVMLIFSLTVLGLLGAPTLSEWSAPRFYVSVTPFVVFLIAAGALHFAQKYFTHFEKEGSS